MSKILRLIGRIVGRLVAEAELEEYKEYKKENENDLVLLQKALMEFLSEFMEIKSEITDGKLYTYSICPVYDLCKKWCEEVCVPMAESFAHTVNWKFKVKRVSRAPELDRCIFEFTLGDES